MKRGHAFEGNAINVGRTVAASAVDLNRGPAVDIGFAPNATTVVKTTPPDPLNHHIAALFCDLIGERDHAEIIVAGIGVERVAVRDGNTNTFACIVEIG